MVPGLGLDASGLLPWAGESIAEGLGYGCLERLMLQQVGEVQVPCFLMCSRGTPARKQKDAPPRRRLWGVYRLSDKPADSAALWNMALRVEAEMVFPTGGTVVSRSGVVLFGATHGSMWR